MQIYKGPTRRALRKTQAKGSLTVDGIRNHEEERAIYVRQKFTMRQFENEMNSLGDNHNYNYMSDQWVFEEEKGEFDARVGNQVDNLGELLPTPFTQKHTLTDRLLLNKTFKSMHFKPDNAHNYLEIDNQSQIQLAPLLCSSQQFDNVTHPPIVSEGSIYDVQDVVEVDFSMYGRYWVGALHDLNDHEITNRNELAPYFMDDMEADVEAGNGNNFERFSAYGFTLNQLPSGQKFRQYPWLKELGLMAGSLVKFYYNTEKDIYQSEEFTIKVPWPLNNGTVAGHEVNEYRQFTVPSISTRSSHGTSNERQTDHITPYHYWKTKDLGVNDFQTWGPRFDFPAPADMVVGGARMEERNSTDFVAIPIDFGSCEIITGYDENGDKQFPAAGAGSLAEHKQIYLFIPAFRILKGNKFKSLARPRRVGADMAAVVASDWSSEKTLSNLTGPNDDLLSQVPFWAYFEDTRYLQQHITKEELKNLTYRVWQRPRPDPTQKDLEYGYEIWDHQKVASFVRVTDALHRPLICIEFVENLPSDMEAQIQVLKTAVVDNRSDGAGAIQAAQKELVFLLAERADLDARDGWNVRTKKYFRLRFDECNTFKNGAGEFEAENYDVLAAGGDPTITIHPILGAPYSYQRFRETLWQDRRIQVEILPARGGFSLNNNVSPFRNESLFINAERMVDGEPRDDALEAARKTPGSELGGKPLAMRSVFNFLAADIHGEDFTSDLPQAEVNGLLSTVIPGGEVFSNFQKYDNNILELFIPRRRQIENHFTGAKEVTVECIEPFFGYCSGSSQLGCEYPLDTQILGKNFPITIQDYQYQFSRDASPIVSQLKGYIKDPWTNLVITAESDPVFTTISEKINNTEQEDKSLMRVDEITPTFNAYEQEYVPGQTAEIQIQTRSGMFEYIFLFCKYKRVSTDTQSPYNEPVVTKLRFKVRGRQNQFVRVLDSYDIERLSRGNSNTLCNWRELHEKGQGVLLHLADIGLTEEIPFPKRKRIQLEISLLEDTTEKADIIHEITTDKRIFHAVLIRQNQRMVGDAMGVKFQFLNESR